MTPGLKEKLAPTDCRLRPDQHHLELGEYDQASRSPSARVLCTASCLLLWLEMRCGAWVSSWLSCQCQMRPPQQAQALHAPGVRVQLCRSWHHLCSSFWSCIMSCIPACQIGDSSAGKQREAAPGDKAARSTQSSRAGGPHQAALVHACEERSARAAAGLQVPGGLLRGAGKG